MLKDLRFLRKKIADYHLIINDSFQPAALALPVFSSQAQQKMLLIFGDNLRDTVLNHLNDRWPRPLAAIYRWATRKQINSSRACLVHSFSFQQRTVSADQHEVYLPTPVAPFNVTNALETINNPSQKQAVIYLNPHFRCTKKAQALYQALLAHNYHVYAIGEGVQQLAEWKKYDTHLTQHLAQADLFISGTGMAAAHLAYLFQLPFIAINTDQPEQKSNLERLQTLSQTHVLNWHHPAKIIDKKVRKICRLVEITPTKPSNHLAINNTIETELDLWVDTIRAYS